MSAELLKLSYFPDDGRIWRFEWVYDVNYNPAVPSESVFVAATAPLTEQECVFLQMLTHMNLVI